MSSIYSCTGGGEEKAAFASRSEAVAAGWTLVEIVSKARVKYHVLCPACGAATPWLRNALSDEPKKEKKKA